MTLATRYARIAPVYDLVSGLEQRRRRSIDRLALSPGARVLLVGAGTGLDLPLLPRETRAAAIDVTPAMLARARSRVREHDALAIMDGQLLPLADASFDAALLHFVLAVVPDPARCLAETARVVRPGGRIAVLGMFLGDTRLPRPLRRVVAALSAPFSTDVDRSLDAIVAASGVPLEPLWRERGLIGSAGYRCPAKQ